MELEDQYRAIEPSRRLRIYDLLSSANYDVSDWERYKGGRKKAAANPKYCYNWSFHKPKESIAVCIWHAEISLDAGALSHANNLRRDPISRSRQSAAIWKRRALEVDQNIQIAYTEKLPIYAIVLGGEPRNRSDPEAVASVVSKRLLDPVQWAVVEYDFASGDFILVRGANPVEPKSGTDTELAAFEGMKRLEFRAHRHRESRLRKAKIEEAMKVNGGKLFCEVPNCGFDFESAFGELGRGYAQVHHLVPLAGSPNKGQKTRLSDLAVVCANCHAMVHLGGECRPLVSLRLAASKIVIS